PSEPEQVVALLGRGDLVWTDVGVVGTEIFLSHQSYGYVAQIQEGVEQLHRPRQRYLRLLSSYRMPATQLSDARPAGLQLEIEGRAIPGKAGLVTIANVETYRGFLSLTPTASPVDGFFDVCVIPWTTRTRMLAQLLKLAIDLPGCRDEIGLYRGRHVRVRVNRRRPEEVRVLPSALPVLVPPGSLERLKARQAAARGWGAGDHAGKAGAGGASRIRARASSKTSTPSAIHTTWRSRLSRLKASPAWDPKPSAAKATVLAPSSAPRLPGTKNVTKR